MRAGAAIGCISFLGKPIQSREILDDGLVALAGYVDDASRKLVVALPQSPAREHFAAFIASERVTPVLAPSRERLLATLTDDNPYAAVIDAQLFASCAYEIEEILMKRKRLAPFQLIVYAPDDQSNMAAHTSEHFTCHIASHMTGLLDATIASLHIDRKWLASLRAK